MIVRQAVHVALTHARNVNVHLTRTNSKFRDRANEEMVGCTVDLGVVRIRIRKLEEEFLLNKREENNVQ